MDPRVATPPAGLARQHALGTALAAALDRIAAAGRAADASALPGAAAATPGSGRAPAAARLDRLAGELAQLYGAVQGSDATPTPQTEAAVADRLRAVDALLGISTPAARRE